ncbi:hypothetical protein AB0H57_13185 [Micromonospora sp. NPDC050686]|uniref:hypothetical protein n=1 Tax=Micromonospora sp. NPDC050686 TaxID=3154631 RepID=UPI0033CDFFB9
MSSADDVLVNTAGAGLAALASPVVARYGQSVVRSTSTGPDTGTLSRPRYTGQRRWAVAEAYRQTVSAARRPDLGPGGRRRPG